MDTLETTTALEQAHKFVAAMNVKFEGKQIHEIDVIGRRFIRIMAEDARYGGRHVHAFVDAANGDLLKAAGLKAPAKHARGNLMDDAELEAIVTTADQHGGYLYLR